MGICQAERGEASRYSRRFRPVVECILSLAKGSG